MFRTLCMEKIRKDYPGIEPRNDFELARLSERRFKGSPIEIYAQMDEDLADHVSGTVVSYEVLMELSKEYLNS